MERPFEKYALDLSERFYVFPLKPGEKTPLISDWPNMATQNMDVICMWQERWPDANVGVLCGRGLLVIDIDSNTQQSRQQFLELQEEFGELKMTYQVRTPRGLHLYFGIDRVITNTVKVRDLFDLRGDGGYVVGAGSIVDSKQYEARGNEPVAPLVASWYPLVEHHLTSSSNGSKPPVPDTLYEGGRNDGLFRLASSLRGKGLAPELVKAALLEENETRCQPPLSYDEVILIVGSASRYTPEPVDRSRVVRSNAFDEILAERENLPDFPLHCLPSELASLASQASRSGGYAAEFVAVPGLAVLATAIGATHGLRLATEWVERPILWTGSVAYSGGGKSPGLKIAVEPLKLLARGYATTYDEEIAEWKILRKEDKDLPPPVERRTIVDDTTLEALTRILSQNPRGILKSTDELIAFVNSLGEYKSGKGGDRQRALTLWDGEDLVVDRQKDQNNRLRAVAPTLSVAGGIQPSRVAELLAGHDGLAQRWLIADCSMKPKSPIEGALDNVTVQEYSRLVLKLASYSYETVVGPREVRLTPEAHELWSSTVGRNQDLWNNTRNEQIKAYYGKQDRHIARLALVLHCSYQQEVIPRELTRQTLQNAIEIADYFAAHFKQILPVESNAMLAMRERGLDETIEKIRRFVIDNGGRASRKELVTNHIGGIRTMAEVNEALRRMEDIYPGSVVEGRKSGSLAVTAE